MKPIAEGQYINHLQYGKGVVTHSDAERTTIDFDLHGVKKFVTSLMVVAPAEGRPPSHPPLKKTSKKSPRKTS